MSEKYIHRFCPCFSWDIEGIQTWLEDMAAKGLHLDPDGGFLGIFSFIPGQPATVRYRLTPAKVKRSIFDDSDGPDPEAQDYSQRCGWEYLFRYKQFYIFRATDPAARPLHTDPQVHAMAMKELARQARGLVLSEVCFWGIYLGLRGSSIFSFYRLAAVAGPLFCLSLIGFLLWILLSLATVPFQLGKYRKRLLRGDPLENRVSWKEKAWKVRLTKAVPIVLLAIVIAGGLQNFSNSYTQLPLEEIPHPFPAVQNLFPGESIARMSMGDYNTGNINHNSLSRNIEWNESGSVAGYHCILRLQYYETASPWLAQGVAKDIYRYERFRYNGKRFEDLAVPENGFDSVRVFSSYGVTHVLIQHGHIVVDAVVSISAQDQHNQWHLWLEAAEAMLLS